MVHHQHPLVPQHPPEHWNSYRPSYNPQDQGPPARPPAGFENQVRDGRAFARGRGPPGPQDPSEARNHEDHPNPNRIPLQPRGALRRAEPEQDEDNGPRLWDQELDNLMGRTTRAYDLVINYARDCPDGKRWSREDISQVCQTGQHLHDDIRVLKHWRRNVKDLGEQDQEMMRRIGEDVRHVREFCELVQRMIKQTENEVRDRVYKTAEHGNYNEVEMQDEGYTGDGHVNDENQAQNSRGSPIYDQDHESTNARVSRTASGAHAPHSPDDLNAAAAAAAGQPTPTDQAPHVDLIERALLAGWATTTSTSRWLVW